MIVYATLLYILAPNGETILPISQHPTAMECSDAMPEWYPEVKDGWSVHCYTPEPLVRPRSRKQGG